MRRLESYASFDGVQIHPLVCRTFAASFADSFNLNFEAAQLPIVSEGEVGTFQPAREALPGWHVFAGDTEVSFALHNNLTLGLAAVSIFDLNWDGIGWEGTSA